MGRHEFRDDAGPAGSPEAPVSPMSAAPAESAARFAGTNASRRTDVPSASVPVELVPSEFVPFPVPQQRRAPTASNPRATPASTPFTAASSLSATAAGAPPGFHSPPAGLAAPLAPIPPRGRAGVGTVIGAIGAGCALLVAGGAALGVLATGARPAGAPVGSAATTASQQCSDSVAELLDETADELAAASSASAPSAPSSAARSSVVAANSDEVAATYGATSAQYLAYTDGATELLSWWDDPTRAESYERVVARVAPSVVATCDRAYG